MENRVIAFTGQRPKDLCGWKHIAYKTLIDRLVVKLREYYRNGYKTFISGGAQGFDQCAFMAVHKMKRRYDITDAKNIVYVPFNGQEKRWVETGCFGQEEYRQMLDDADEVKVLAPMPQNDKECAKCLLSRNDAMIKDADLIIALYAKDDWLEAYGGTAYAMKKAYTMAKEIHQIKFEIRNDQVIPKRIKKIG